MQFPFEEFHEVASHLQYHFEKYFFSDTKNSDEKAIIEDLILKIKGNYRSYRECIAGTFFAKSEIIRSGKVYNNEV